MSAPGQELTLQRMGRENGPLIPGQRTSRAEFAGLVWLPSIASREQEIGPREDQNGCNKGSCDKSFHRENMPSSSSSFQVQKHYKATPALIMVVSGLLFARKTYPINVKAQRRALGRAGVHKSALDGNPHRGPQPAHRAVAEGDVAAVRAGDVAGDRQPQPRAALILVARIVEPQERLEHFLA